MAYVPVPYTTVSVVERILRTSNNKITIGPDAGQITNADVEGFILDASKKIDAFARKVVIEANIPIPNHDEKTEIGLAAAYLAVFDIYRAMYRSYRTDEFSVGVEGFKKEATDMLDLFIKNVDDGVYPDLSPSSSGIQIITGDKFFQTEIGVESVHSLIKDQKNQAPEKGENLGPWC